MNKAGKKLWLAFAIVVLAFTSGCIAQQEKNSKQTQTAPPLPAQIPGTGIELSRGDAFLLDGELYNI